ncbi:hypothetical protein GCM10010413_05490 [Promicromonospora sukumoe]
MSNRLAESYYDSSRAKARAIRSLGFFPLAVLSVVLGVSVGQGFPIVCGAVGSLIVGPMFFRYVLERFDRRKGHRGRAARNGVSVVLVLLMVLTAGAVVAIVNFGWLWWALLATLALYLLEYLLAAELSLAGSKGAP